MRISDWSSDVCSSDLPRRVAPEYLVQLQLEAHRQTVGQNPFDQLCRCQLSLPRREQHGTAVVEAVFDDAFACPVVIGTITNHELDFVVRQQSIEILPEIARSEESRGGKEGVRTGRSRW